MSSRLFTALCFTCAFCSVRHETLRLQCDALCWTSWSDDYYEPLHGPDALWLPHRSVADNGRGNGAVCSGFLGRRKRYVSVWSLPSRSVTTYKNNIRQSVAQYLFYVPWYICQGDMFRPSRSFSGLPRKQIQELLVFLYCGIPNAHKFQLQKQKYINIKQ